MSSRLSELHPRRFFLETWRAVDEEARAERAARRERGLGYDFRPLVVMCTGAAFLTMMEPHDYWGGSRALQFLLERFELTEIRRSTFFELYEFVYWALWRVLAYLVLPAITLWLLGQRVRDYGLRTTGLRKHLWIYAIAFVVVLVCVVLVSYTDDFSSYYPFYKRASRSWFDFVAWELLYAAQFFSLEFFFRGFWLQACRAMMGSHAIFAMIVPYCMIHFGKPMPEAFAAILAGVVLGTLAMKTRSIWSGFLIHVSVALSMDVAALLQTHGLPTQMMPGNPGT